MGDLITILIYALTDLGVLPPLTTNDLIKDVKDTYYEYRIQSCRSAADNSGTTDCATLCAPGNANTSSQDSHEVEARSGSCNLAK